MEHVYEFSESELEIFKASCNYIRMASIEQRFLLLNELLTFNPMCVWEPESKIVHSVESVCIKGLSLQINCGTCFHDI